MHDMEYFPEINENSIRIICCNHLGEIPDEVVDKVNELLGKFNKKTVSVSGNNDTGMVVWEFEPEISFEEGELMLEHWEGCE